MQELERYNKLIKRMSISLANLQKVHQQLEKHNSYSVVIISGIGW